MQPEHLWLADMILSLVYFRYYRWKEKEQGGGEDEHQQHSSRYGLESLEDSRRKVLKSDDSAPNDPIWRLFDSGSDCTEKLAKLESDTLLLTGSQDRRCIKEVVQIYRDLCKRTSNALLEKAAEKVISEIVSTFASTEYTGIEEEDAEDRKKQNAKKEADAFTVFFFGKLAAEEAMYSDWKLEFISESDRMVRDLLASSWNSGSIVIRKGGVFRGR